MAARRFPNVYLVVLGTAVIGELAVEGDALEHRSKKHGTVRMERIRGFP